MRRTSRSDGEARLAAYFEHRALVPGDRLPAERVLARELGISRELLRAGLQRWEADGKLHRSVGQGTFWGRTPSGRPVRDTVLIEATSPHDIMDARLMLEPEIAAAAARTITPEATAHLRHTVIVCREARDLAACEAADSAFHVAVARAAGNPVLQSFLAFLSDMRRRAVWQQGWDRTYRTIGLEEFRSTHAAQHGAVFEAIAAREPEAARTAMRDHLEAVAAVFVRS